MLQDPESVLRAWYELVGNQGCEDAIDKLLAGEGMAHGLRGAGGNTARGLASFKHIFQTFRTVRGAHLSDSLGIYVTSKTVEFTDMNFARIADGKMVEGWNNFDFATMQAQLQNSGGA